MAIGIPSKFVPVEEKEPAIDLPMKFRRADVAVEPPSLVEQAQEILKSAPSATGPIDFITGSSRKTQATESLPEIGSTMGYKELLGDGDAALASAALTLTFDPIEAIKIIEQSAVDPVALQSDGKGNIIVSVGDRRGILNKPGVSGKDILQLVGNAALYAMPAAKFTAPLKVGLAEAGIQTGVEGLQKLSGGDFNPTEIVVAGVGGAAFQKLGLVLSDKMPNLFGRGFKMTDDTREIVRKEMLNLNLPDTSDKAVDQVVSRIRASVTPRNVAATAGELEFDIPLTQGQRTGVDSALSFEDSARAGSLGEAPQRIMRGFETESQLPAIDRAVSARVASMRGPGTSGRGEVGATLRSSIDAAETSFNDAVQAAYSAESIGEASLTPEGFNGLLNATRKAVIGFEFDRTLPQTEKALQSLRQTQRILNSPGIQASIPIRRIEQQRRRFQTLIDGSESNVDRRQLVLMKRAFDDYLDKAVIDGLFSGNENALSNMKEARGLMREYAQKFRANPGKTKTGRRIPDPAGDFMEKVIEANPTDEQVVNMIFGASKFSNNSGAAIVRRIGDVIGKDSVEFNSLREEAFRRVVKMNAVNNSEYVSGTQTLKQFKEVMEKNGTMMRELFTDEEIGVMGRLFAQIKRTQPDLVRSRENPSGSGVKAVKDGMRLLSGMFDGGLTFNLTGGGIEMTKSISKTSKAAKSVRPFANVVKPRAALTGFGVTAGVGAGIEVPEYPRQVQDEQQ